MTKPNHLLDHLRNPANRDEGTQVVFTANPDRLRLQYERHSGDWGTVAGYIYGMRSWPVTWFPDANVAFVDQMEPVWDALRLAALGSPIGSAVISGVVEHEMGDWLSEPHHHHDRAKYIRAALGGKTWLRKFGIGPSCSVYPAILGYARLLGVRRSLARPLPDGSTLVGTDAAAKTETLNAIRKQIGLRAEGLAKKGRIEAEKKGKINVNDETHCLMMILYALTNRKDSVILTTDPDYLESFFKVQWFLDTHFRAWLAAQMVKNGRYGQPAGVLAETRGYFVGPLTLYRRHTPHLCEVLPACYRSVRAGVVYVAPDGWIHKITFPFELQMLDMLQARATTNSRCTDLFGDANIHVDLGPLKVDLDGLYLGIGRDEVWTTEINGIRTFLPKLDLEHALNCCERFVSETPPS